MKSLISSKDVEESNTKKTSTTHHRFFACYLLTPVSPSPHRHRCTYVGFTVDPERRLRQHNGELVNGAKRTCKYRPWEMVVVIHGFPSKFHALQFEYAWQHPYTARLTRSAATSYVKGKPKLGSSTSVARKILQAQIFCTLSPWKHFSLTFSICNSGGWLSISRDEYLNI